LMMKEALAGEITENDTTEVIGENSARRRWVTLCWILLAWWVLNFITWFIYTCTVSIIAALGLVICPTQHVFSTSRMTSHLYKNH
ncbi:hypothetical protein HYDPIDRAFT_48603, partial [Hydnomerulius pinastri MD-312]